jgi:hypothetical protein
MTYLPALLVIANDDQVVVFVSLDLIGISQEFTNAVRRTIRTSTGVARRDIILTATHTHCGPVTIKHFFNADQQLDAQYMEILERAVVEAIEGGLREKSTCGHQDRSGTSKWRCLQSPDREQPTDRSVRDVQD